jgi:hypothetical protein
MYSCPVGRLGSRSYLDTGSRVRTGTATVHCISGGPQRPHSQVDDKLAEDDGLSPVYFFVLSHSFCNTPLLRRSIYWS